MVLFRIYSVFYYLGLTVLCLFLSSHPISHHRCVVVMRPLPGLSGLALIVSLVRRFINFRCLCSGFFRHLFVIIIFIFPSVSFPLIFYFERSSIFRIKCRGVFRPICRTRHEDLGDSVCFWN